MYTVTHHVYTLRSSCVCAVDITLGGLDTARCLYGKLHVGGGGTFCLDAQFKKDYYNVLHKLFVHEAHDMSTSHCSTSHSIVKLCTIATNRRHGICHGKYHNFTA